ncbi:hypothetical protein KPH14_003295 [Odynerus spinipes]|uniref:Uncharacterized protein n=1 Tax=Odynerus spinipes TaxID=1348599 RepID=A0AAD9RD52_9HYME|nr:hypothetical protein KPH14_003295 [Odynerus spinipes]
MLVAGIMEMKHTDIYIDINKVTDEELLDHPIFIHNFLMCILSIFVMTIYLVHTWLLFDVWRWVRKYKELPDTSPMEYDSEPATSNDTITIARLRMRNLESFAKELPGELDPIPTLDKFPSRATIDRVPMENEPVIFYCCFVDCYNYLKESRKKRATHEFQVIHVL